MLNHEEGLKVPSVTFMWYYFLVLNKVYWIHRVNEIFFHFLPAAIVDSLACLTGRKPV